MDDKASLSPRLDAAPKTGASRTPGAIWGSVLSGSEIWVGAPRGPPGSFRGSQGLRKERPWTGNGYDDDDDNVGTGRGGAKREDGLKQGLLTSRLRLHEARTTSRSRAAPNGEKRRTRRRGRRHEAPEARSSNNFAPSWEPLLNGQGGRGPDGEIRPFV